MIGLGLGCAELAREKARQRILRKIHAERRARSEMQVDLINKVYQERLQQKAQK